MGPLFILGFPRSGTTAMAHGIAQLNLYGRVATEGHFLHHFRLPLAKLLNGDVGETSAMSVPENRARMARNFAAFVNATLSPDGDPQDVRWMDKTPDEAQVLTVPLIAALYPEARYVFLYRPPVDAVRSNLANFPAAVHGRELLVAERWMRTQAAWREARAGLRPEQWVDVFQPQMLSAPGAVAARVGELLRLGPGRVLVLERFWANNGRINRPAHGPRAAAYDATSLPPALQAEIVALTAPEAEFWPELRATAGAPAGG